MGDEGWILDVEIILGHLLRRQLTLVCDSLGGERIDVKATLGTEHGGGLFLGHFAHTEEFAVEITRSEFLGTAVGDEELDQIIIVGWGR